ncbi:MAG: pyridoxamine 5'-phosphate oxidase family protein [Gammaproteobacteria bacterium]|nr:pyridoxamine 5'-phosphate oxidase family protein [Gammaproteobacteria bacterium]
MPFNKIHEWLESERSLGISEPESAILSTASKNTPHSRVVAIREIKDESAVFFTSSKTRKVDELLNNPTTTINFWLSVQKRQIILEGKTYPLMQEENEQYWSTLSRDRQLRFSVYAPFSGREIGNVSELENMREALFQNSIDQNIPRSEFYMGFRFIPETIIFYTLIKDGFSEVVRFTKENDYWRQQQLSP